MEVQANFGGAWVDAEWAIWGLTKNGEPTGPSTTSDFPGSPGSYPSQRGLDRSEFPWKPFLWPSLHVISQVGCNQTPTGQRMSSQTAILGFHPNCLHFLFKLVISPQVRPCLSRDLLGRGHSGQLSLYHSQGPREYLQHGLGTMLPLNSSEDPGLRISHTKPGTPPSGSPSQKGNSQVWVAGKRLTQAKVTTLE